MAQPDATQPVDLPVRLTLELEVQPKGERESGYYCKYGLEENLWKIAIIIIFDKLIN